MLPLADITVLAVEQFGAGPWATLQLADLGANVIKVEDPRSGGDVSRYVPPYQDGEDSLYFETFNRNKRSVSLDLRTPAGREAFEALVRNADAVFSNLRGDQPEKLGITYAHLSRLNPRIVCCSLSGFGASGPRVKQGGYDYVMQGLAGWMSITGEPDGPPTKSGLSLVDFAAGYVAALALIGGLWKARREGVGCDCDISLFETALSLLTYLGTWTATAGYEPARVAESGHPSVVPFQAFQAADGWIVIACPKQKFWEQLCRALGRGDLLADERFRDFAARLAHREELLEQLRPIFRAREAAHWLATLGAAGVPVGPVNEVGQALADEQTVARGAVVTIDHPRLGPVRQVASPLRLSGVEHPLRPGPARGEHTAEVLREQCGMEPETFARLADAGAFGSDEGGAAA